MVIRNTLAGCDVSASWTNKGPEGIDVPAAQAILENDPAVNYTWPDYWITSFLGWVCGPSAFPHFVPGTVDRAVGVDVG